jgi:hypothetical protein
VRWRQRLDDGDLEALWACSGRAPSSTRMISRDVREMIARFWEEHSRASPDFKRALRHRIGPKQYEEHGACFLEMTQTQLYLLFRRAHADVLIGQRSFEACKPWFIRYSQVRDTCLCRYHVQFDLMYGVFSRLSSHAGVVPSRARDFVHAILCQRLHGEEYHRHACVQGSCVTCGSLLRMPSVPEDIDRDESVTWQQYQYEIRDTQGQAQTRRLTLVPRTASRQEFIDAF